MKTKHGAVDATRMEKWMLETIMRVIGALHVPISAEKDGQKRKR